jgi:hypothetical protein
MVTRLLRSAGAALVLAFAFTSTFPDSSVGIAQTGPTCGTDLKLLVVAADGKEPSLAAIRRTLDYLGTPYEVVVAATAPAITAAKLSSGCRAFYQGVIFTTAELTYASPTGFVSAFELGEQATIHAFAAQTGARELVWFSDWTGPAWGINWPSGGVDTTATPITATFTPAGTAIFSHVNTANPLKISNAWTILTTPTDASVTPLLVDAAGHSLAVTAKFPDGRETLTLTFASNPHLTHSQVLGYDLINWVTKGIFLGERHAYMSPQIDDLFLANTMWTPDTPCGTPIDSTTAQFRMTGSDVTALVNWQTALRKNPLTPGAKMTWAFNGWGAYFSDPEAEAPRTNKKKIKAKPLGDDTLTAVVRQHATAFHFVSHTWDHPMLDTSTVEEVHQQLTLNNLAASNLGLGADPRALVTPNVSGLTNPNLMKTAYALGVRYVVTDTSIAGYNNPTPNTGLYSPLAPGLFMIPRYPTNLYFNVSTPAEWTAEYNCVYGPKGNNFWGRDLTYQEILNNISDTWVSYLLNGDLNPVMFHQPNTRAYDGVRSLLGDLIDMTVQKYGKLVKFPILFPSMAQVGDKMIARQKYNEAGVTATLVPGVGIVLTAAKAAVVPVTGLKVIGAETYAGSSIAYIPLAAGQTTTIKPAA